MPWRSPMEPFMSPAAIALGEGVEAGERTTGRSERKWAAAAGRVASRSERKRSEGTMLAFEARVLGETASAGCMRWCKEQCGDRKG